MDVVLAGVDAIDVAAKEIVLDEDAGRLPYDYLILAAGPITPTLVTTSGHPTRRV